jgi:putative transcriptional regulator
MSDEDTIRARRTADGRLEQILPDGSTRLLEDGSDWARFDAITDEEAYQNALDDPDNPPLTPEQLAMMRSIPNPRKLRLVMKLTQKEFARQFEISLGTLRDWEERVRHLDRTAISYLRVIEKEPDAVRRALGTDALQSLELAEAAPKPAQKRAG